MFLFFKFKMENFKNWMKKRDIWNALYVNGNKDEMKRILLELQDQPIGISCEGVYKCTYSFIGQVSS